MFGDEAEEEMDFNGRVPKANLQMNLKRIENTMYDCDADFQQAMYTMLLPLRDGHTNYIKPKRYKKYYALQPIRLMSLERELQNKFFFYSTVQLDAYNEIYGKQKWYQDLSPYQGWEVTHVNGLEIHAAIHAFAAADIGQVKDAASRWNIAVHGWGNNLGFFYFRSLGSFGVPKEDHVKYTLVHPQDKTQVQQVHVYWMGLNGKVTSDTDAVETPTHGVGSMSGHLMKHYVHQLHQHRLMHHPPEPAISMEIIPNAAEYVSLPNASALAVGILRISTFSSNDPLDDAFLPRFASDVMESLAAFETLEGTKTLIIDLRGNGGGDICLGYALLRYLFPQLEYEILEGEGPHKEAKYHVMQSKLFQLLAHQSYVQTSKHPERPDQTTEWNPSAWYSSKTKTQYKDTTWINTGQHGHSQNLYYGCSNYNQYFAPPGTNFKALSPDHLYLMSDGLCGSTCAIFSSFIQQHNLGKTIVFGGSSTAKPQQFWSFPGGQVYSARNILNDAHRLHLPKDHPLLFNLTSNIDLSFAMVAIQPWKKPKHKPLEYTFIPAHYHLPYIKDPSDTSSMYFQIITQLASPAL